MASCLPVKQSLFPARPAVIYATLSTRPSRVSFLIVARTRVRETTSRIIRFGRKRRERLRPTYSSSCEDVTCSTTFVVRRSLPWGTCWIVNNRRSCTVSRLSTARRVVKQTCIQSQTASPVPISCSLSSFKRRRKYFETH